MRPKCKSLQFYVSLKYIMLYTTLICLGACTSSGDDSGSNNASGACDIVANAAGPAYFEVKNNLSSGLAWYLPDYAFGADMKPGECTKMGVPASQITMELQHCNISNAACTSYFGVTKTIVFSVLGGQTYTLSVTSNTFN